MKKTVICFLSAVFIFSCIVYSYGIKSDLLADTLGARLGVFWKQQHEDNNDSKNIFTLNGAPITQAQIDMVKEYGKANGENISDDDAYNTLIGSTVLYQEAVRRGLAVSYEEARQQSYETRDWIKSEPDTEGLQLVLDFIKGSGYTIDEYFENSIPEMQKQMTIGRLLEEIQRETKNAEDVDMAVEKLRDDLVKKSEVIRLN